MKKTAWEIVEIARSTKRNTRNDCVNKLDNSD